MKKKNKIILLSFGSNDLKRSIDRLKTQAKETKFYDEIRIFCENDLESGLKMKLNQLNLAGKKRGYGYFFWKPSLIKIVFDQMNDGDVINYIDVGFHLVKEKF